MTCPLFVELCAGTAAVSLRLHGGPHARPPVSRMGAKTGYAHAILHALGLRQGQGHVDGTRYLLCEPDPGVRLLLHAYTDRELAQAAAAIIRSWKDEDPRALWERLRAEGLAVCPDVGMDAREVARWLTVQGWAYSGTGLLDPAKCGIGNVDSKGRKWGVSDQSWISGRLDTSPTIPATIRTDARTIEPARLPPGTVAYMDPEYQGTTSSRGNRCLYPVVP